VVVGFAAESQTLLENARAKLEHKKLDLIVANDITASDSGFSVDTNRVTILDAAGGQEPLPLMDKLEVSHAVLRRVHTLLQTKEIVHVCKRADWDAARTRGEYRADSLEKEGFIHCSRPNQVLAVANRYFQGVSDLVLLWIKPKSVRVELRWEAVGDDVYPHIYGPLNLDAVTAVRNLDSDSDGVFRKLLAPSKRADKK
jgi:uncharacterized protein (DUF952 family)